MRNPFKRKPTYIDAVNVTNTFITENPVRVEPGDVVFIQSERRIPRDVLNKIKLQFQKQLPDNRVVVLENGLKVVGSAGPTITEIATPHG